MVKNFEAVQKKWLHAELELKKHKELLVKSDVARSALEVKLKHARNQLDVEIKKRYKAEADYQCLVSKLPCFNTNFYQQTTVQQTETAALCGHVKLSITWMCRLKLRLRKCGLEGLQVKS